MVSIKTHEINIPKITNAHNRRALKSKNDIITSLRLLGLTADDVKVEIVPIAIKRIQAKASWWIDGYRLYYSYKGGNFAENLAVVAKVIEKEVNQVVEEEKTIEEFISDFNEETDVEKDREDARAHLGIEKGTSLNEINKIYKKLAKKAHPDMPTGDTQTFKELNRAHKILKRELE